ncbi:MAG: hypothetical protein K1Y02_17455 [Candidatus Hydrogenedentes bacterium]|nr:hypothetical protein [Candidatus Hydrogenedentota bacterium]
MPDELEGKADDVLGEELRVEVQPTEKVVKTAIFSVACVWVVSLTFDLFIVLSQRFGSIWVHEHYFWAIIQLVGYRTLLTLFVAQVLTNL